MSLAHPRVCPRFGASPLRRARFLSTGRYAFFLLRCGIVNGLSLTSRTAHSQRTETGTQLVLNTDAIRIESNPLFRLLGKLIASWFQSQPLPQEAAAVGPAFEVGCPFR